MHMFMTNLNKAYERASLQYKQRAVHREDKNERLSKIKLHRQFNPMNLYVEKLPQQTRGRTKLCRNKAAQRLHYAAVVYKYTYDSYETGVVEFKPNRGPVPFRFVPSIYMTSCLRGHERL